MSLADLHKISHIDSKQFILISGPCAIEGEEMAMRIAEKIKTISDNLSLPYIFKGSFKKANRSRMDSFTGIGDEKALKILEKVGKRFNLPTITDIHQIQDAAMAANYVDIIQIPAFLVRQTDLLIAAAKTNKFINLKKGQFMSPESMQYAVDKIKSTGNENTWITDRGTQFGYQDLIVDFRGIPIMKKFAPTILDVTHSLQQPNQVNGLTGGRPESIETIARAGISTGVDGIFIETHFDPANAKSDGSNMLDIKHLEGLLSRLAGLKKYYEENLSKFD
jgi:2-dehydro-3-deoxyphosphooctonate aldolase (KDO 8-P synthase)